MEEERKIEELQRLIDTHENIVFFGGAGVSTEAGFRISAVWTGSITSSISTRLRPS